MNEITIALGLCSAFLIGFAKNGVPGSGILIVPLMAMAFEAKQSVGTLLPMLIVGDVVAITYYRCHAHWDKIRTLFPWVVPGMVVAALVLDAVDSSQLRRILGTLVLGMLILEQCRKHFKWERLPHHVLFIGGVGFSAGFATTLGNAAGSIMNLYLMSKGMPKFKFVGTAAWFFFLVNVTKLPLYSYRGMITLDSLRYNLTMVPMILLGAYAGIKLLPHIPQQAFNAVILILTAAAALSLLL